MLRRIVRKLTNNFGLKILAVLFAAILWIVVVNIDDPIKPYNYTTSITFENQDFITNKNKIFEILDGSNTITFRVSAKRSILDKLSNADFTATADMEKIEYDEEKGTYRVPVVVTQSKYSSSQVTIASNLYKDVTLEDLGKVQKPILAETSGIVAEGCALGTVEIIGSNIVKIQGPASIVSQIDKVVASVNVDGMATDVTDVVIPTLYDADGNVVDTTKLKLSVDKVSISAQILNTKDVSLEFLTSGTVEDGYVMTGISYRPETVRIKGEAVILNPINKVTIPKEVLDLTGATSTIETTVDISSYLPSGTSLVVNSDAKVEVTVTIEPIKTKKLEIPVRNLTIENLNENYELEFLENTISVELAGAASVIDNLRTEDVVGTVDAAGIGSGEHHLEVKFALEELECELTEQVRVPVTVSRKENGSTGGNVTSGGSTSNGGTTSSGGATSSDGSSSANGNSGNDTAAGSVETTEESESR